MPPPKILSLLRPLVTEWDWQLHARCRFTDGDLFFHGRVRPARGGCGANVSLREICADCTVRLHCRDHALVVGERHGVWGGMSEIDRREMVLAAPAAPYPRLEISATCRPPGRGTPAADDERSMADLGVRS